MNLILGVFVLSHTSPNFKVLNKLVGGVGLLFCLQIIVHREQRATKCTSQFLRSKLLVGGGEMQFRTA